jgi:hypothetical protein
MTATPPIVEAARRANGAPDYDHEHPVVPRGF